MAQPIVFISTHRIKPGMLEALAAYYREGFPKIEASTPGTVLFQGYLDEAGEEVCFVHAFPDADAMDVHFAGAQERAKVAYEYLEPQRFDIYGSPNPAVLEAMRQSAAAGIEVVVKPEPMGGFIRLVTG